MAELTFYYGPMGCSKTANALMIRYQHEEQGRNVWLIKPAIDTRDDITTKAGFKKTVVRSRVGISAQAEAVKEFEHINIPTGTDLVICDEAQFLQPWQVDELVNIAKELNIPVICYGLRTDFKTYFFPGSKRLFEIADRIIELETFCSCGAKATISAKFIDGHLITEGEQIDIGGDEKYKAICYTCWNKLRLKKEKIDE